MRQLLTLAATSAAEVLRVDYASILELQRDRTAFLICAGYGWESGIVGEMRVGADPDTLAGYMLSTSKPVIVIDLNNETRFRGAPLLHEHDIISAMGCMIPSSNGPYGVLVAFSKHPRTFTEDDVHYLQAVAHILAGAIERQRAHDELDRFFTPAQNPMFIGGFDGYVKRLNRAVEIMSGYSRAELTAEPIVTFIHPDEQATVVEEIRKLAAGGATSAVEMRVRCRDGSNKWTHWSATPFPDLGVFYAIGYDVSDRHAVQAAMAEREEEIRILLDSLAEGVYGIDLQCNCTFSNAACRRLLGYDAPEDLLGKPIHELVRHSYRNGTPAPIENCEVCRAFSENRGIHVADEVLWRRDGTSFPAEYWSYPVRKGGKVAGCVVSFLDISLRVQATAERDRFFNHALTPMCVLGFDGYFKNMNPAFEQMFGYSRDELLSMPYLDLIHPEERERAAAEAQRIISGGVSREYDFRVRCKDGSYKWMAWDSIPFPQQQAFYAIGHDVSDRHQFQEALAEQARLAALRGDVGLALTRESPLPAMLQQCCESLVNRLDAAFARVWTLNSAESVLELQASAGLYTHLNGAHARIPVGQYKYKVGLIAEQRKPHLTNAVIGDPQVHDQEWAKREGLTAFAGYPLLLDDRVVGVVALFSRQPLSEAAFAALASVADGISLGIQRKRVEEALRASEETLRVISESAPDAVILLDDDGKVAHWNPAAERIFGYARDEMLGRNCHESVTPEEFRPQYRQGWSRFRQTGEGPAVGKLLELEALHKDGSRFPVEISVAAVSLHGRWNAVGIVRDITERKRAEAELVAAKQAAEAASRSKSEFLANMSHEVRTPMNGIIGLTSLVLDTNLSREQRQYLDGVMLSAEALLKIINDILDFSKIEAGRLELEKLAFDLRETLGNTVRTLALRAHEKGLELLYDVRSEVPDALIGDPVRLWQVLVNLVGNAVKFTHQGEVSISVSVESLESDSVCLQFTVSDTGIGIPDDKRQSLFKPFFQVDSSMTRKYGGTGLGLAISSQIVQMMKGRIWFESEVGKGTQFHFTAWFDCRTTPLPKRAPLPPSALDGLRVLVVDDNATNRRILRDMLTHWGMRPEEAEGGEAALAALQAAYKADDPFGLILLDVMMPVMDGFAVLERIRQMPEIDRPVILMLSSGDQPGNAARARALGASAYIVKPIRPSELLDAIVKAMGIAFEPAQAPEAPSPASIAAPRGPSLRILVAEDNPVNQMLAVRILEKAGHSVAAADNGEEVLSALVREAFDLVLMDVQMPVMDGFEATALIRQQEKGTARHQPIVAMTAHAMKGDREKCLEAGMDGYVSKPVRNDELFAAIAATVRVADALSERAEITRGNGGENA